jgi:putative endonuclease
LAAKYLQDNGYEMLDRNWTFQKAKIDIIAKKENYLAIVEVKTRSSLDFWRSGGFCETKKNSITHKSSKCLHKR